MTTTTHIIAASGKDEGYRIEHRDGCVIVHGSIPLRDFSRLGALGDPDDVAAPELAKLLGVSFAFGPEKAVAALVARIREERLADPASFVAVAGLSPGAQRWYVAGEHGMSAATLFFRTTGIAHPYLQGEAMEQACHHPHDPADLRRCRLLVEAAPEVADTFRAVMPTVSPTWSALVSHWDELCGIMDSECPGWRNGKGNAPLTLSLMGSIRMQHHDT